MAFKSFGFIKLKILWIKLIIIFVFVSFGWISWFGASDIRYKIEVDQFQSPAGLISLPEIRESMMKYQAVIDTVQFAHTKNSYQQDDGGMIDKTPVLKRISTTEAGLKPEPNQNTNLTTHAFYGEGCGLNPYRKRLQKLLQYWNKLIRHKRLEYFLCDGSLLGYQRTADFIPYDHDIDICLNKKGYQLLLKLESKLPVNVTDKKPHLIIPKSFANGMRVNCKGVLVEKNMDPCSIISPAARVIMGSSIFLDVYLYKTGKVYIPTPIIQFEKHDIYPTKPCWLAGIRTRCPNKPRILLSKIYGKESILNPTYVCKKHQFVAAEKNERNNESRWFQENMKRLNKKIMKRLQSKRLQM